jgi:hypothetical protein
MVQLFAIVAYKLSKCAIADVGFACVLRSEMLVKLLQNGKLGGRDGQIVDQI